MSKKTDGVRKIDSAELNALLDFNKTISDIRNQIEAFVRAFSSVIEKSGVNHDDHVRLRAEKLIADLNVFFKNDNDVVVTLVLANALMCELDQLRMRSFKYIGESDIV